MLRTVAVSAALAMALTSRIAVSADAGAPSTRPAPVPIVQIQPGDQVKVEVFGNPDLATTTTVADDGSVRIPLAGAVSIGGRSPAAAAQVIEAALKNGEFLLDPHVTVTVAQSFQQAVTVLGEVGTPGRYALKPRSTVLDALALAGGLGPKGSNTIYVLRTDASGALQRIPVQVDMHDIATAANANLAAMQLMRDGDSIVVPKGTFTIIGQVAQPGEYRVEPGMMLFQAIARAGGVTALGSASRVEIRRQGPDEKYTDLKGKKDMRIEPGDILNVKERLF